MENVIKEVTCSRFQEKGHHSNDPACPTFERNSGLSRQLRDCPQIKAVPVQAAGLDEGSGTPDGPLGEADGAGELCDGSQCESVVEGESSSGPRF